MVGRGRRGRGLRWSLAVRLGRAVGGPHDPSAVALVGVVLAMLGPPERWAVYTVPGPRDLPGPDEPQWRRDRWWRDHVSAVGGALLILDPDVDVRAVRRAVELVVACATARERGLTDPADIALRLPVLDRPRRVEPGPGVLTALEVMRRVAG